MKNRVDQFMHFTATLKLVMLLCAMLHFSNITAQGDLHFIKNRHQWNHAVLYKTSVGSHSIFISKGELVYNVLDETDLEKIHDLEKDSVKSGQQTVHGHAYSMKLQGSSIHSSTHEIDQEATYYNYFMGKNSDSWASHVPAYHKIIQEDVYPNIDWVLYSEQNNFKYDFIIHPKSKPDDIVMNYTGIDKLTLTNGSLIIQTSVGDIIEQKPYAYQIIDNVKREVQCSYIVVNNEVRFSVDKYNKNVDLVIDPIVIMGTYSGATDQMIANCSTFDSTNNMYSSGTAINGFFPVSLGAYRTTYAGIGDVVIAKYNAAGTAQIFATYLGGFGRDMSTAITIDRLGRIIVCGYTYASDFPVTFGCYDALYSGDTINRDAYVSILNSAGSSLIASTFYGGAADDEINDLKLDNALNIYVCGSTNSFDFPVTSGVYDNTFNGNYDAFVSKLTSNLSSLISSTYIGANFADAGYGISLDPYNNIYLSGTTSSSLFPTTTSAVSRTYRGASDAYVSRFNNSLNLLASTFIGTTALDYSKMTIYDSGFVYVLGYTDMPFTKYPLCKANSGGGGVFLNCFKENLDSLVYRIPLSNMDISTNITAFELSDSNYFLISVFLNLIRGTFPDSVYTTDSTYRLRRSLYFVAIAKNAEDIYYASFINNFMAGHIHGTSCRFNKKNNRLFQLICSRATETATVGAPHRFCITGGEYDMFSLIYQPTISTAINYRPSMRINDSIFCSSGFINFNNTSVGINSFKWIFPNGQMDSIRRSVNFTNVLDGLNVVKLIVKRNCSIIDTLIDSFYIPQKPSSNAIRISDSLVCIGSNIIFSAQQIRGNRNYWRLPSGIIDSTNDTILYTALSPGLHSFLLISDSIQCPSRKDTVKLNFFAVNSTQALIVDLDSILCAPIRDSLQQASTNYQRFVWSDELGNVDSTHRSFYVSIDSAVDYHIYLRTYGDVCASISTDTFHIRTTLQPISNFSSSSSTACIPSTISFSNTSSFFTHFYWVLNDSIIDSSNNIINILFSEAGNHEVKLVSSSIYCDRTDTQVSLIRVFENPSAFIDTNLLTACIPLSTTLVNSSNHYSRFYWFLNDSIIDSSSITLSMLHNSSGYYHYKLLVFGDSCPSLFDSTVVTIHAVDPPTSITNLNDTSACKPFSISILNLSLSTDHALWLLDDSIISTAFDSLALNFTSSGDFNLQTISWNNTCPLVSDTATMLIHVLEDPQALAITSALTGCPPLNIELVNQSLFTDSLYWQIADSTIIFGDTLQFLFSNPGQHFIQQYAYNSFCNSWDTNSYNILVSNVPKAIIFCPDTALCAPDTATLLNISQNYANYYWSAPTIDSNNLSFTIGSIDSAYIISQLIVFGDECPWLSDTAEQTISFKTLNQFRLFCNDTVGCQNMSVHSYLSDTGSTNRWITDPATSLLIDRDTVDYVFTNVGLHTIQVEVLDLVCLETPQIITQSILVYPQSHAAFYYTPLYAVADSFAQVFNASTFEDSVYWVIDDSIHFSKQDSFSIDSISAGMHTICLFNYNQYNCNDSICQTIYVLQKPKTPSPCKMEPVSAFTPNADGINDDFFILLKSVENIQLSVFNRWGEQVYQFSCSDDYGMRNDYWDGSYKGREQPLGAYSYVITATCKLNQEKIIRSGNVTLLR